MSLEINDAIHKSIWLSEREAKAIAHPFVQRLRFIKQLGFVSMVYPSATHDRFSHALGTMHVVGLLGRQMFYNESHSILARKLSAEDKEYLLTVIRLAGLLHDVGHAPFSHTAERVMPHLKNLSLPPGWYKDPNEDRLATHEDYSVVLIAEMAEGIGAVLDKEEAEVIASLIHHKKIVVPQNWIKRFSGKMDAESLHAFVRSLVSGDIDGDRMDYLLRDSHFTGVVYGHFDLHWLISNLGAVENQGQYMMSISDTGVHALEHYLFARYHMYVQVYMHKTVKCFEYYFQQALDTGETLYKIPPDTAHYTMLRDATILENLFEAGTVYPHSWSGRLLRRKPAKRIARVWDNPAQAETLFKQLSQELKHLGVHPFFYQNKSKFLDLPPAKEHSSRNGQGAFLFGLWTLPVVVIRKHLEVVSIAPIADYSFLLKHYHRDILISDVYILPEEYEKNTEAIKESIKKFRVFTASEIPVQQNEKSAD